jgi:hypothetical protein
MPPFFKGGSSEKSSALMLKKFKGDPSGCRRKFQ